MSGKCVITITEEKREYFMVAVISARKNGFYYIVVLLLLIVAGCGKKAVRDDTEEPVVYAIRKTVSTPVWPQDARDRADLAVSLFRNKVVDPTPILIGASLSKPEGSDNVILYLAVFDEDKDILGVGLREEYATPNGQQKILEEIYPVYAHSTFSRVVDARWMPIKLRISDERKDEYLWQNFLNCNDYQKTLREYVRSKKLPENSFEVDPCSCIVSVYNFAVWADTLPPIWVTIPKPGKIDVWIWVYDKAGNKSEPVKLLNFIDANSK